MAGTRRCNKYLPEEIIFIVLSWLPVKTLLRFKSVCKSWRLMISDIQFVRTHLTNSRKKQAVLLNFIKSDAHIDVHYTPQDSYKLYLPPNVTGMGMEYIYSCDGLVCLSNYHCDVIYIWNPLTKLLKLLPTPSRNFRYFRVLLALGFDPISNDYKLLRIATKSRPGYRVEAELYSSKADSWKDIQVPETLERFRAYAKAAAKPGILYLRTGMEVLAFDLHKEVFREYPIPRFNISDILDFEGYAAMVFKSGDVSGLFVLNDVCGKVVWTKLFNLECNVKISKVVRYLGMGKFVIDNWDDEDQFTYIYDYKTKEAIKSTLRYHRDGMAMVIKYTESLVSLNGFQPQD